MANPPILNPHRFDALRERTKDYHALRMIVGSEIREVIQAYVGACDLGTTMSQLRHALKTDPSYRESWKANISMAVYDEIDATLAPPSMPRERLHQFCNRAAECFLQQLEAEPESEKRCPHGIRYPHECRECEAAIPNEAVEAFRKSLGIGPR